MIVGVMLRHYKSYYNINFIPFLENTEVPYSVFIGNNGVGKSAILEAIDVFFNDREWNVNVNGKKQDAFICPVFLVKKEKFNEKYPEEINLMTSISDYFWDADEKANANISNNDHLMSFLRFKNKLKHDYREEHYLLMIGIEHENKNAYFNTFNGDIRKKIPERLLIEDVTNFEKQLINLKKHISDLYSYVYIPVEQSIQQTLKLENTEMQAFLSKNILEEIESVLNKNVNGNGNGNGSGRRESVVDYINQHLEEFMVNVNGALSNIDKAYSYNHDIRRKLTARDIRDKILDAYFPLRTLKKDSKPLVQLSSGEQRKALIDTAYAFLTTNPNEIREREIILAIDEPETSMHVSNCFDQFERLEKLTRDHKYQVLITTHWYGFMPITEKGFMHYVEERADNKIKISSYSFYNYLEERRSYPDVVELKSLYDLATSILTFMRSNPNINWLVCEGSDDKMYLEYLLRGQGDFRILPVGGCGNVVKLFQLLYSPISEKVQTKQIDSKILFLIDTDRLFKKVEKPIYFSGEVDEIVHLRRLQIIGDKIELVNPLKNEVYEETEIEDCLNPQIYYDAISKVVEEYANQDIKDAFQGFEINDECKFSKIKGDESLIIATSSEFQKKKKDIINYLGLNDVKYKIAKAYIRLCEEKEKEAVVIEHSFLDSLKCIYF